MMHATRDRLHEDLLNLSEGYRSLVPTDQARELDEGIEEFLAKSYDALLNAVRGRLARLPTPPGKDDSWSW